MSDENKIRDAADAIRGVVDAVPIYQDLVQPAAKEVGVALQTLTRAIHVALAPVSAFVWGYDKIRDFLAESLTEKLRNIPPERIISPDLLIAGPAIESLRFAGGEPTLRDLYANLLATSMDAKTCHEAHPAFVEIIQQLAPDEARILTCLRPFAFFAHTPYLFLTASMTIRSESTTALYAESHFSLLGQEAHCTVAELVPSYVDNLCRLGLIKILETSSKEDLLQDLFGDLYLELEMLFKTTSLAKHKQYMEEHGTSGSITIDRIKFLRKALTFSDLGDQFCENVLLPSKHE